MSVQTPIRRLGYDAGGLADGYIEGGFGFNRADAELALPVAAAMAARSADVT